MPNENYRFFGSAEDDEREYNQEEFAEVLHAVINNGYIQGLNDELLVQESDPKDMSVQVNTGQAWVEGYWYKLEEKEEYFELSDADSTDDRIDRIILELDTVDDRAVELKVLEGTAETNPDPPSLTRDSETYQISLAQVYVEADTTSISDADITDERDDNEVCGKATSTISASEKYVDDYVEDIEDGTIIAMEADTLDGEHYSDIQDWVENDAKVSEADNADTLNGEKIEEVTSGQVQVDNNSSRKIDLLDGGQHIKYIYSVYMSSNDCGVTLAKNEDEDIVSAYIIKFRSGRTDELVINTENCSLDETHDYKVWVLR